MRDILIHLKYTVFLFICAPVIWLLIGIVNIGDWLMASESGGEVIDSVQLMKWATILLLVTGMIADTVSYFRSRRKA